MAWDVTQLAETTRRLDVSSTLRAFASPAAVLFVLGTVGFAAWQVLTDPYGASGQGILLVLFFLVSVLVSPLLAVFADALARQNMPRVSGLIAAGAGFLLHAFLAFLVLALAVFGLALLFDGEARSELARAMSGDEAIGGLLGVAAYILYGWVLWRTIQVETVLSAAPSRALLLGDVGGAGIWPRLAYILGVPSSMWRAGALVTAAFWLFLLARVMVYASTLPVVLSVQGFADPYAEPPLNPWLLLGAGLVLFAGGHLVFLAGKRLAARRIWKEESAPNAGPILFLRSFQDDQFRFSKSWRDPVGRWLELWSFRRNADEMLIDEFAWYGPVIALGQPGEKHAPFGAARRYVDHDTWQNVVEDAAARAHTIIVAAGETPGLIWEYELISRKAYFAKTVYLFPPHPTGSEAVGRAVNLFRQAYPEADLRIPEEANLIAAVVSGGTVKCVTARAPTAQAYLVALRQFLQSRETVLGRTVGDGPMPVFAIVAGAAGMLAGIVFGLAIAEAVIGY